MFVQATWHICTAIRMKHAFPHEWQIENKYKAHNLFDHTVYYLRHPLTNRVVRWNSRDHRKGKIAKIVNYGSLPRHSIHYQYIQISNISWWVSVLFTLGSIWWLFNGIFIFHLPLPNISDNMQVGAYFGLAGGITFLLGGYAMYLEALNISNRNILGHHQQLLHANSCSTEEDNLLDHKSYQWRWYGNGDFKDLGYTAAVLQFIGTIIFGIGPITGIPNVLPDQSSDPNYSALWIVLYWLPQVIGATFLTLSSYCIMIETQSHWYKIRPFSSIGWHVGFWNIIGSVGFLMSGAFGCALPGFENVIFIYGVALTTYIGSYAFLLGSVLQYLELIKTSKVK